VRSFNEKSRHPDVVVVSAQNRCEHFIRPLEDDNLAINGNYTYCQVDGKFVPEDYLGCSYVMEMSKFLKCKYEHVPPKHVMGYYQLMQERYYPIYRNGVDGFTESDGNLIIDRHGVQVEYDEDRAETFTYIDWHTRLKNIGFLVMPCIWRSGAGVYVGDGDDMQVGCLVPTGTRRAIEASGQQPSDFQYIANYDHIGRCYHALVEEDTLVPMQVIKTMDSLIPPGTILWLRSGGPTWNSMKSQFPRARVPDGGEDQREVQVRLNIPIVQVNVKKKLLAFLRQIFSATHACSRILSGPRRRATVRHNTATEGACATVTRHDISARGSGPLGAWGAATACFFAHQVPLDLRSPT
jgi:hypothetical protein